MLRTGNTNRQKKKEIVMKSPRIRAPLLALAGLCLLLLPSEKATAAGNLQVTITDLGVLPGGSYSSAYSINNHGKIAGHAYDINGALTAVQWVNGVISPIPSLDPSTVSLPEDMNDAGEMAGTHRVSGRVYLGVYWNSANFPFQLPSLANGTPTLVRSHAITASGLVAGMGQEGSPNYFGHAVVWYRNSLLTDLGFMGGGTYSEAYGINDFGDVVGAANVASTAQHAFLWSNGQFTDLSTWAGGGASSIAHAINNKGEIVGLNASVASLWKDGAVQALPMPAGISAYTPAVDINDAGDIIATGSKGYPIEVGVLWRNGQPIELGTLPGGTISRVRRINATGEIVGEANTANGGPFHAVKWTVNTVAGNTAPTVTLVATSPTTLSRGQSVSFRGTFTDPDAGDGPWTYTWTWGNGSTAGSVAAPGNIVATRLYATRGTFKVTLTIQDARGGSGKSNAITIRVR